MATTRRLNPLWTPGGSRSSRPAGIPSLVTSRLGNDGPIWSEDFFAANVGVATAAGHPSWILTNVAGSGTAGVSPGLNGALRLSTGASANDVTMIDGGALNASGNGAFFNTTSMTTPWIFAMRLSFSGTGNVVTNGVYGAGLVGYNASGGTPVAIGSDWISDPDTTLLGSAAGSNSLVVHRSSAAYSGNTAGALILRFYEASGTDDTSVELSSSIASGTNYKLEFYYNGNYQILVYLNGTLATTVACPSVTGWTLRPSWGAKALTTSARTASMDWMYWETAGTAAR